MTESVFVTVGTQEPFPRLVAAVDAWAGATGVPVLAQVGTSDAQYPHCRVRAFLSQTEHAAALRSARLVVAHAGIGSIFSTLGLGKPLVVMPRRAALGEHRNDHQAATVAALASMPGFAVAADETALPAVLDRAWRAAADGVGVRIPPDPRLLRRVRRFLAHGR